MAYTAWSVVFGEQPSAAKWNLLGTNDAYFNDFLTGAQGTAWATWSPTWTNITLGNGVVTAKYTQVGKTVKFKLKLVWGTTTSQTAVDPQFTLPTTSTTDGQNYLPVGIAGANDTSASTNYMFTLGYFGSTKVVFNYAAYNGAAGGLAGTTIGGVTATVPATWATGDTWWAQGEYEAP